MAAAYGLLAVALWPLPVLQVLHAESSAVLAAVGYFAAGLSALGRFRAGATFGSEVRAQLALLLVPLALLTVSLAWAPNCAYATGLLFFVLFPVVSVVLGVAVGFAASPGRRGRVVVVGAGVAVLMLGPLYDLGLHPQFYTYNHVFGGVLGPVYDEELALRRGLFAFRGLTLLWAGGAYAVGRYRRAEASDRPRRLRHVVGAAFALGIVYALAAPLGINTPAWWLEQRLGGRFTTPHFAVYLRPDGWDAARLDRLAEDLEYRYAWMAEAAGGGVPERVRVYLYPDAQTKAALTGARYTSVAPVWLRRPQVHVLEAHYDDVFPHELAHVFSRPFGMPGLRATRLVGLVEGWAVALEAPDGLPSPHEQVAATAFADARAADEAAAQLRAAVAQQLTPHGFWTGRGAVSYTAMGSFVRYLLERYGTAPFRAAYAWGAFEEAYALSADSLAAGWVAFLRAQPYLARGVDTYARRRFAVPSLFEKACPHHVPGYVRQTREAATLLREAATLAGRQEARRLFGKVLAHRPEYVPALEGWAAACLALGDPSAARRRLSSLADTLHTPTSWALLGDAAAWVGQPAQARRAYRAAYGLVPAFQTEERARLALRAALVEHPGVLATLYAGGVPEAARGGAPRLARALALPEDQGEQAVALLRTTPPIATSLPGGSSALARQRSVWTAQRHAQGGAHAEAAVAFQQAAASALAAGDLNGAARWLDQVRKHTWLTRRPDGAGRSALTFF